MRSAGITMINVAVVILAGGKSSRMGQDKATLPYKGKRLVDAVADVVRAAGVSRIYVSGMIEGYTSIPDFSSGHGPVSGISTCALRLCANHERLLFLPVDMPYVRAELLQRLIEADLKNACHFEGNPLPCIIPLDKKTMRHMDEAAQMVAQKQKISVKYLLALLKATALSLPPYLKKTLTNTNTPEEWQEVVRESTH